jgi:sterol 24-C-methyltransferase
MASPAKSHETSGRLFQRATDADAVRSSVTAYEGQFAGPTERRRENEVDLARSYYQLVTDFYEFGWGKSFHFAPRRRGESLESSLGRFEREIADRLQLRPGMKALDVGCGVGGPMRTVARTTGAKVVGISIAPYHIERATRHNVRAGLEAQCQVVEADFNGMPFEDESFDAAFTIDACCYATDRRRPFREVFRVLKPGSLFVGSDWGLTDRFRPDDTAHQRIKAEIEKGNGIAALADVRELDAALSDANFEVLETRDLALSSEIPWYQPLRASVSLRGFRNSRVGIWLTHQLVRFLEVTSLSPGGTVQVHDVLRVAQSGLVQGGEAMIFTPLYFWVARKPA